MSYTNFQKIKIMKKLHPEADIYFTPLLIIKILILEACLSLTRLELSITLRELTAFNHLGLLLKQKVKA